MTGMSQKLVDKLGDDYAKRLRERREFEADRERGAGFRVTYMAHAKGYVMCRRPGATPFVVTEKEWRSLKPFDDIKSEDRK